MARSVNKVILLGNLGKDAETKFTPSGVARSTFTLATSWRRKDPQSGEWKDETDWHNVVVWRAENLANYLLKGKQVYVEGRLTSRSYEDKDGQKKYFTEVVADEVILCGSGRGGDAPSADREFDQPVSRPRSSQRPQPAAASAPDEFGQGVTDDDVPF